MDFAPRTLFQYALTSAYRHLELGPQGPSEGRSTGGREACCPSMDAMYLEEHPLL